MKHIVLIGALSALSSCGSVYKSPIVRASEDGTSVQIVAMTAQTVRAANNSTYQPRSLPAIFDMTAGSGSGLRGAGALPDAVLSPSVPPKGVVTRTPPSPTVQPYDIGIGDVVLLATPQVNAGVDNLAGLQSAQDARQQYTVQDDGSINIPRIGRVLVAGLTLEDAEATLFQQLVENQIDPTFSIEIAEFNSHKVAIGGAVGRPTVAPITLAPLYLDEAIADAGGIAVANQDYGALRIYRDGALYEIALNDYLSDPSMRRIRLVDGDSVFVDTSYDLADAQAYFAQQITLTQLRQQSRQASLNELNVEIGLRRNDLNEARDNFQSRGSLGAEKRDYVYLTGEVGKQGRFPLPYEQHANLADALFDEGGGIPLKTGDVSQIYVLRASDATGAVTAWNLDATNAANFTLAAAFELRPNDIIFVAEQPVTRWNRVIQQMTPSLITTGVAAATN